MPRSEWSTAVVSTTTDPGPQSGRSGWTAPILSTTSPAGGRSAWVGPIVSRTNAPVVRLTRPDGTSDLVYLLLKTASGLIPAWPVVDATPLATLTVTNFIPVTPTTTGAVFTFQTPTNVPVTRIMEYRKVGDATWTTYKLPVVRNPDVSGTVSHTAGYTGLTLGTAYEARITLSADGFQSVVLTAALGGAYASLNFTTATTTAPVPTVPKLPISPPTLVDPLTIEIPVAGGNYKGLNGRDVRWIMPPAPVVNTVSIFGGGSHHIIGGEARSDSGGMSFDIEDYAGTCYVEGVVADPTGLGDQPYPSGTLPEYPTVPPFYSDGYRVNSRIAGSHFVQQNCYTRVDGFAKYADGTNGPHGDAIQLYRGPSRMTIHKLTIDTYYQGLFLLASQFSGFPTFGAWRFSNIDVWRHASAGGAGAFTLTGPTDVTSTNCYARRDPGSNTSLVSGPSSSSWVVNETGAPGGPFTPRTSIGVGYVSPGYL